MLDRNSALAELRCATSGFETVLKQYFCLFLCIYEGTEKGVFFINERHTFFSCVSKNQG